MTNETLWQRCINLILRASLVRPTRNPIRPTADQLLAALERLPEPARSVYLLNARDELSYSQIGAVLGLTTTDVERHLAGALLSLDLQIGTNSIAGEVAHGATGD